MWIGTTDGAAAIRRRPLRAVEPGERRASADSDVFDLLTTRDGSLWIATAGVSESLEEANAHELCDGVGSDRAFSRIGNGQNLGGTVRLPAPD